MIKTILYHRVSLFHGHYNMIPLIYFLKWHCKFGGLHECFELFVWFKQRIWDVQNLEYAKMFWKCEFKEIFFKDYIVIRSLQKDFKQKIVNSYCALVLKWNILSFTRESIQRSFFLQWKSSLKMNLK
jgi:hypothetical protein